MSGLRKERTEVSAPAEAFVGLTYGNPPGGTKTCLNTKIASCEVHLEETGRSPIHLRTASRASFEILTTDAVHEVPVLV